MQNWDLILLSLMVDDLLVLLGRVDFPHPVRSKIVTPSCWWPDICCPTNLNSSSSPMPSI
jgi:hypothetical protein